MMAARMDELIHVYSERFIGCDCRRRSRVAMTDRDLRLLW